MKIVDILEYHFHNEIDLKKFMLKLSDEQKGTVPKEIYEFYKTVVEEHREDHIGAMKAAVEFFDNIVPNLDIRDVQAVINFIAQKDPDSDLTRAHGAGMDKKIPANGVKGFLKKLTGSKKNEDEN